MFREHGKNLNEHLQRVADIVEKLLTNGWDCSGGLYTLEFFKEGITKSAARKELKKLKIDEKEVHIEEFEVEEE